MTHAGLLDAEKTVEAVFICVLRVAFTASLSAGLRSVQQSDQIKTITIIAFCSNVRFRVTTCKQEKLISLSTHIVTTGALTLPLWDK